MKIAYVISTGHTQTDISIAMLCIDFKRSWKVPFTLCMEHECTVRNHCWWMFVHVSVLPSCLALWAGIGGQSLVFLLFGLQDRSPSRTHSRRERGDDSMVWCWLKEPKEEHSLCCDSFFFQVGLEMSGGGISLCSGASTSCCAHALHSPHSIRLGTAPTTAVHHA